MKTHLADAKLATLCGTHKHSSAVVVERDATCRTCVRIASQNFAAGLAEQSNRDQKLGLDPIDPKARP